MVTVETGTTGAPKGSPAGDVDGARRRRHRGVPRVPGRHLVNVAFPTSGLPSRGLHRRVVVGAQRLRHRPGRDDHPFGRLADLSGDAGSTSRPGVFMCPPSSARPQIQCSGWSSPARSRPSERPAHPGLAGPGHRRTSPRRDGRTPLASGARRRGGRRSRPADRRCPGEWGGWRWAFLVNVPVAWSRWWRPPVAGREPDAPAAAGARPPRRPTLAVALALLTTAITTATTGAGPASPSCSAWPARLPPPWASWSARGPTRRRWSTARCSGCAASCRQRRLNGRRAWGSTPTC